MINFLENVVPDNAVVVLHTLRQQNYSFYPELWESDGNVNIYSVLNKYKAVQINELKTRGSLPYILIYRKNNPDFEVKEAIGDTINQFDISHGFKLNKTEGRVLSTTIGPASSWENSYGIIINLIQMLTDSISISMVSILQVQRNYCLVHS